MQGQELHVPVSTWATFQSHFVQQKIVQQ